jgi:pimeloyl-ACP methyl ester carboxylesterase
VPYLKTVFESLPELADLPGPQRDALAAEIQYGVRLVAFEYTTTGPAGEARKASALAMLPTTPRASVATLVYMHGTSTERAFIPSVGDYDENVAPAVLFAARGRLVVSPDYLGLGASDLPYHPYLHRDTLAAAGRDALTAGVELARRNSLALVGNLFIAGYSEGGFAAAALQRQLQQAPLQALGLRSTMSIAGPLDLPAAVKSTLSADPATGRDSGRSIYTAFTVWSYQRVYGDLYSQATEVFNTPYADQLDALFGGTRSSGEIGAALPASPRMLLTTNALTATISGSNQIAAGPRAARRGAARPSRRAAPGTRACRPP